MDNSESKYMILANWIKKKIETDRLSPGDKFCTENALASMFNVSRQTVRQAISVLVQEKILEGRQGSGTFIADKFAIEKTTSKNIGVITTYFDDYIFPSIIKGVETVLSQNGYFMQLACTNNNTEDEARAIASMMSNNVDGFIVEPTKSALPNSNKKLYDEIAKRGIPIIFLNAYYPETKFPYVAMDDVEAGRLAAQNLIDNGHIKFALALKSDDIQGHLRYQGITQALNSSKLEISSKNIFWYTTEDINYIDEDFLRLSRHLEGCTGLVCYNDKIAAIILKALKNRGVLVPDQMSVVSIDNSDLAALCETPLTSVAHPKKQLGIIAAENMLKLLEDKEFNATYKFTPTLVERKSVSRI